MMTRMRRMRTRKRKRSPQAAGPPEESGTGRQKRDLPGAERRRGKRDLPADGRMEKNALPADGRTRKSADPADGRKRPEVNPTDPSADGGKGITRGNRAHRKMPDLQRLVKQRIFFWMTMSLSLNFSIWMIRTLNRKRGRATCLSK